jgi:hypothetical protein
MCERELVIGCKQCYRHELGMCEHHVEEQNVCYNCIAYGSNTSLCDDNPGDEGVDILYDLQEMFTYIETNNRYFNFHLEWLRITRVRRV